MCKDYNYILNLKKHLYIIILYKYNLNHLLYNKIKSQYNSKSCAKISIINTNQFIHIYIYIFLNIFKYIYIKYTYLILK